MMDTKDTSRSVTLTIGALAECAGVGVETIRYYQRRRLLQEPAKPVGGIRRYGSEHADRVYFIRSAQRLGFTLDEVSRMLLLDDGVRCAEARHMAALHLDDVRQKLGELRAMERQLQKLVDLCASQTSGNIHCPLIASLKATGPRRAPRAT